MTDTLYIGDETYSSWSLRGWLLFEAFGIDAHISRVDFSKAGVREQVQIEPARTVPTCVTSDGDVIWDSLALAEELASRHPDAGIWPKAPAMRALARCLAAEMHSSFAALRNDCPMNLRQAYTGVQPSDAVQSDLRRLEEIWEHALQKSGGPWLCGAYSAADAFYAPVAGRIAGYGLAVSPTAQAYVDAHLADPAFRRWRAMALVRGAVLPWYAKEYGETVWPGPRPLAAKAVEAGPSVNDLCPNSGKPVTHFLELEGKVYGYCNAFCRDKSAADPEAWPKLMALHNG